MKSDKLSREVLWQLGKHDHFGRWWPVAEVEPYFLRLRTPSRQFPNSYRNAATTKKFWKWLETEHPDTAQQIVVKVVCERLEV